MEIGKEFNIQPYGTEALSTLRISGMAGPELDGRTIPYDVSLEGLVSKKKILLQKIHKKRHSILQIDKKLLV